MVLLMKICLLSKIIIIYVTIKDQITCSLKIQSTTPIRTSPNAGLTAVPPKSCPAKSSWRPCQRPALCCPPGLTFNWGSDDTRRDEPALRNLSRGARRLSKANYVIFELMLVPSPCIQIITTSTRMSLSCFRDPR